MRSIFVTALVAALAVTVTGCTPGADATAEPTVSASPEQKTLDGRPVETQLFDAIQMGDAHYLGLVLQTSVDVNAEHSSGNTALALAITRNDVEMVRMLISAGATVVFEPDPDADPPIDEVVDPYLVLAAQYAGADVVRALVAAGAEPNGRGDLLGVPLTTACYAGNLSAFDALYDLGADIHQPVGENQYTALTSAAYGGNFDLVQYLVELGADIDYEMVDGNTAADWAAARGHNDIANYLIELGG